MSHPSYRRQILCPRASLLIALICWLCERLPRSGWPGGHARVRATPESLARRASARGRRPRARVSHQNCCRFSSSVSAATITATTARVRTQCS